MNATHRIALLAGLALVLGLSACATQPPAPATDPDAAFEAYARQLVEDMLARSPEMAVYSGRYENAATLTVADAARRAEDLAFAQARLAELDAFDPATLSANHRTDFDLVRNRLASTIWYQTTFRAFAWNPSQYNVAGPIGLLLNTDYAPEDERLATVLARMARIPDYYAAARESIEVPTLEHTRLAIGQNRGALSVFGPALLERVDASGLSADDKTLFRARAAAAREAIEGWIDWLENKAAQLEADGSARPFRIGEERYEAKFRYDIQSGYSARALYDRAVAEKERLHAQMDEIATALWPKYFPDAPSPQDRLDRIGLLIDHLSNRHVAREAFIDEIKRQVPLLEAFVAEHDLLDQDPTRPLVVRETPLYMRGSGAGASISAPGPFNPQADTYYNVTPLDDYSDEQAASYLREYNHWVLQVLNIHEAVPGHYTQLVHANKSPSLVKAMFGNGAMVEGWAVYAERMMLEAGWGEQEPELWLMYGKWNLRVVCNTILDYRIQVLGADREEILDLLRREAFQEETEATNKWLRATLSQVQLTSYFAGFAEIYDFREAEKQRLGDAFSLRDFHNAFLSYGRAPVRVIRELMSQAGR